MKIFLELLATEWKIPRFKSSATGQAECSKLNELLTFAAIAMKSYWREKTQTKPTYFNINNTTYSLL